MERLDFKISFCVVCMNRLHQLRQTLIQNILDNAEYENLEFVVLDYNSMDGMEEWVKQNLAEYIKTGRVVYYKTTDPDSWSPSHSKNLAFKLATGDIVCSIWADYYTGAEFARYVNDSFKADDNIVLTPIDFHKTKKNYAPPGDVLGKVCVKRNDFLKIHGFDERMNKHGFEDYDFVNRLEMMGVRRVLIEDFEFLKYLRHDDSERFTLPTENLEGLYVNYLNPSESEILFLYKDFCFERGTVIDNFTNGSENPQRAYLANHQHFEYSLKDPGWTRGNWKNNENRTYLESSNGHKSALTFNADGEILFDPDSDFKFHRQANADVIDGMLRFHHFIYTRAVMEQNMKRNNAIVNENGFGKAAVYKNFNYESNYSC